VNEFEKKTGTGFEYPTTKSCIFKNTTKSCTFINILRWFKCRNYTFDFFSPKYTWKYHLSAVLGTVIRAQMSLEVHGKYFATKIFAVQQPKVCLESYGNVFLLNGIQGTTLPGFGKKSSNNRIYS
jgi:hypothetical protein